MKATSFKIGICMLMGLGLLACKKENDLALSVNPDSLTDPAGATIFVGDSKKISVESFGVKSSVGYVVPDVKWSVSDSYIATVDESGAVTGLKVGPVRVTGSLKDGRYVFTDFNVLGLSYLYIEPKVNSSASDIKTYEESYGRILFRGSEDEGCLIYQDTLGTLGGNCDYVVYILGKGAITNLKSDSAYNDAVKIFLPERYNVYDTYFANPYNVRVYNSKAPLVNTMNYTSDKDGSGVDVLAVAYKQGAKSYEDKIASASSYSKETLGLVNDITYETVDKDAVSTNVTATKSLITTSNSVTGIETTLADQNLVMMNLYLAAGKESAIKICRNGLKEGYDESKYYPAVWDSIQVVDANAQAEINDAETIKLLDQTISSVSKGYTIFLPKSTIDSYYKVQAKKEYESYAVDKKEQYDEAGLAALKQIYDDAIVALEKAYALKDANNALKAQKDADKLVPTKND